MNLEGLNDVFVAFHTCGRSIAEALNLPQMIEYLKLLKLQFNSLEEHTLLLESSFPLYCMPRGALRSLNR